MKKIFILLLLCSTACAGEVKLDGQIITYDDELSFKDFTNWNFTNMPNYNFSGKTIYGSNFSNQVPETHIFPNSLTGATFVKCDLSNVFIPPGNTTNQCKTRRFKVQNDRQDWILDGSGKPVEPLNKGLYEELGISTDPKDIPDKPLSEDLVIKKLEAKAGPKDAEVEAI